jgi:hypothetical protein
MEGKQYQIYNIEHLKVITPPEEAYLFFPNDFQIVEVDKKHPDKILRRIFEGNNDTLPVEKTKLANLYQEIEKHNNTKSKKNHSQVIFPAGWKEFDTLRFHQATGYKSNMTIQLLIDHFEWRQSYFPFSLTPAAFELLNKGFIYVQGREHQFRPIFIVNAKFYVDNMDKYVYDDWLACIVFFMEYMIKNLLIPGQVENWNIISDVCGVSLLGLPKDMKRFMNVLQSNYRCRLYVNFIYGMGTFLGLLWNMVKVFLDETSLKKIRMLKKGQFKDILTLVNPEQLEQKYGGTAPDVKENFFPPIFPSNHYLKDDKSKILVSEEVYKDCLKTKVIVPSPFFLEREAKKEQHIYKMTMEEVNTKEIKLSESTGNEQKITEYIEEYSKTGFIDIKTTDNDLVIITERSLTNVREEIVNANEHKCNITYKLDYFKTFSSKNVNTLNMLKNIPNDQITDNK